MVIGRDLSVMRGLTEWHGELPNLRPQFRTLPVEPADLASAIAQFRPLLVICSRITETIHGHAVAVIVLYPGGEDCALVAAAGQLRLLSSPRLADLLAAIDAILDPSLT